MISKDEHVRHVYFLTYQAYTFVCEGYTFTQGPPYLFEDIPVDIYSLNLDKVYRIMYCDHLIWKEDYEQALIALGDKESYDIKKMRELCLSDMLYAELFTYRRLDVIYSLYQELTEKGLRDLYSYGTLYAMNRLFFKNEAAAEKIKKRFERHNFFLETDKDKETRMFNLVDELYASGQYSEVYFKKPSKKLDQNTMNTYYIITIFSIFVAAFFHYGIEGGINKYKQDINTENNSLKLEMSEALKQNDCHRLKRVLMMDEYFENKLKDKPVDDNSYYILKKQCQERISELDCDVDIQSSESNL